MEPVVAPVEMAAIDAEAPEPLEELIERAAWAVAREAAAMLDGSPYGKRIAVLAGKGNNGADGRGAVVHLERRGARCTVFDIGSEPHVEPDSHPGAAGGPARLRFDLVIDACFGTGLQRDFDVDRLPLSIGETPVLAVDIPSGIDGLTGAARGNPVRATRTVTFAAHKPGLLLQPGRSNAGETTVADIGLDCSRATIFHLGLEDVGERWPRRSSDGHKWRQAVMVIGGGPGMSGAPALASIAALRSGAGYVTQSVPGTLGSALPPAEPSEAVQVPVSEAWSAEVVPALARYGAAVIGPGLPATAAAGEEVASYLAETETPTVFDAGGLTSLAERGDLDGAFAASGAVHVLTPHDGEFAALTGAPPGDDRIAAARGLAALLGAVVLLKGPTTVVAGPDGRVLLSTAGDARLATAGTGDVLSGVIAGGLAGGLEPLLAAGLGAELHGRAATRCRPVGMTAQDLPIAVADVLSDLRGESSGGRA